MFRTYNDVTIPAKQEEEEIENSKLYVCDFCSEGWSSETDVEIHRAYTHRNAIKSLLRNKNDHICKMCVMQFSSEECLLRHIKADHLLSLETALRVEREIFICDVCGDIFFNKTMLSHHLHHTHTAKNGNLPIKCPCCTKTILLRTCWYHFRVHKLQSIACCKICCKKCKDRRRLAEHLKTHPLELKCEQCGYHTKKEDLYNYHIKTIHRKPDVSVGDTVVDWKKYYMPRKSTNKFKVHSLMGWRGVTLSNDVHICVLCKEICSDPKSMERHIVVDHMEQDKPDVSGCRCVCGMVFSSKVLLKHHMFKFKDLHEPTGDQRVEVAGL